jgi:hypothetical protein
MLFNCVKLVLIMFVLILSSMMGIWVIPFIMLFLVGSYSFMYFVLDIGKIDDKQHKKN